MSSYMMLVLSGVLLLGQIYINSGEEAKVKDQVELLKTAKSGLRKNLVDQEKTNTTQNISTVATTRNCVFRIENGDRLIGVNKTREEIESSGLKIFDEVCEGDIDSNGDKIGAGALASLCCG